MNIYIINGISAKVWQIQLALLWEQMSHLKYFRDCKHIGRDNLMKELHEQNKCT